MRRTIIAVSLAVTVVVGCSTGDESSTSTAATEATAPPVRDTTITTETEPVRDTTVTTEAEPSPATTSQLDPEPAVSTTLLAPSPDADLPTQAPGATVPVTTIPGPLPEPDVRLIELTSFEQPVEIATVDGDGRLFVVQQGGSIVASDDESDAVVFDISTVPAATFTNDGNEQGLLGLAFHPIDDLAYVNFTGADGRTVIAEFAVDPVSYLFDPSTYREVLTVDQPFSNHNGGELAFGPDELLYIGVGDGGSADDPQRSALDRSSRLGKILRIDPRAAGDDPFTVPDDNPFVATDGADPTIWSRGLRNPWRFSFDSLTGDLWIGDVGQNRLEEINLAPATDGRDAGSGLSFGWSAFEANERFNDDQEEAGHVLPTAAYPHEDGDCSVSGGVVARSSSYAALNGWYLYGDYCSGRLWALDTTSVAAGPAGPIGTPRIVQVATVPGLAAIAEGPFGDIYAVSNAGPIYRLAQT